MSNKEKEELNEENIDDNDIENDEQTEIPNINQVIENLPSNIRNDSTKKSIILSNEQNKIKKEYELRTRGSGRQLGMVEGKRLSTLETSNPLSIHFEKSKRNKNNQLYKEKNCCIRKIEEFFSPKKRRIICFSVLFLSSCLFITSIVNLVTNLQLMNNVGVFLLEIINMIIIEISSLFILILAKRMLNKITFILSDILLICLACYQSVIFYMKYNDTFYLIINCIFCSLMVITSIITFISVNKEIKHKKKIKKNIDEIINFTATIEEGPKEFQEFNINNS